VQLLAFRIVLGEETTRPIADFQTFILNPSHMIYLYVLFRKKNSYCYWYSFMLICPSLVMLPPFLCRFITCKMNIT